MPRGQEEAEVTAIAKIGVRLKLPLLLFLSNIFLFSKCYCAIWFSFFSSPTVPFPCGLIRVLCGVLWLPTWDLKEKDGKEIAASEALSWHLSQGGSCIKTPMDNSRSYFKATAVWNRWEEEDQEEWEEEEGKKNEEKHCVCQYTRVDIKTEMPITPAIWAHKGKFPGSTWNLCYFLHIWSHQSKCPEAVIKHTCQRIENSNIPEDWTTLQKT